MILKISLRAKGGVPKTLLEQKHRLNFLYFPQNTLMLTESREEFSDLHSIFRLRALRYCNTRDLERKRIIDSTTVPGYETPAKFKVIKVDETQRSARTSIA